MKRLLITFFYFLNLYYANSQTINSNVIHSMEAAIDDSSYPNIHSILISYNNKIVYEKYWTGKDRKESVDLGIIKHGVDSLHAMQSISKSITSACVGIALAQGKIKSIDEKIFNLFPEYKGQDTGLKSTITIKDLLTMTAGLQWNEDDYNSPENNEIIMGDSPDPVAYVLSQPMVSTPGKVFTYNGGATQVLAAIIQKTTGKPIDVFAKEYLFTPMGITNFKWTTTTADNSNIPDAFSGVYLRSRDLMKFGLLYMNNGKCESKQILPASWVKQSLTPYIIADDGSDKDFGKSKYGFQWWMFDDTIMNRPVPLFAGVGNGGQRVFVDKDNKIVVVFTGGNYRMPGRYLNPYNILKKFIYPALFKKMKA